MGSGSSSSAGVPYDMIEARLGVDRQAWDTYREVMGGIESSGRYNIAGGSGDHYDGMYQLGADAKTDGARVLGIRDPGHDPSARAAFRGDPQMQERLFAGYTVANHNYLIRNSPQYRDMDDLQRLQVLGYAHNQGMGGAENWLDTGVVGADGFGTRGTKYSDALREAFTTGDYAPAAATPATTTPADPAASTAGTPDATSGANQTLTINLGQSGGASANALSVDDVSPEGQMSVAEPADVRVRMMSSLVAYGVGQSINRFFGGSPFGHALGAMGGGTMAEFMQTNQMQSLATIQAFAGDVLKAAASIVSNVRVKIMGNELDAHGTGVAMSIGGADGTAQVQTSMSGSELDSLGSSLTDPKNHEGFNAYVDHEHDLDMGGPGHGNRWRLETQGLAMPNVESIARPGFDDFDDDPALSARSTGAKEGMGPGMSGPGMMGPGRGMA